MSDKLSTRFTFKDLKLGNVNERDILVNPTIMAMVSFSSLSLIVYIHFFLERCNLLADF